MIGAHFLMYYAIQCALSCKGERIQFIFTNILSLENAEFSCGITNLNIVSIFMWLIQILNYDTKVRTKIILQFPSGSFINCILYLIFSRKHESIKERWKNVTLNVTSGFQFCLFAILNFKTVYVCNYCSYTTKNTCVVFFH